MAPPSSPLELQRVTPNERNRVHADPDAWLTSPLQGRRAMRALNRQPRQEPQTNLSPVMRCIKFLACWDCGPVGIVIAIVTFATTTVLAYEVFEVTIWTATKDYILYCQSDAGKAQADAQCLAAAGQNLRPPPFYKEFKSLNGTLYRRTLTGQLLGATEVKTHSNACIWMWAINLQVFSWLALSAICQIASRMTRKVQLAIRNHNPTREEDGDQDLFQRAASLHREHDDSLVRTDFWETSATAFRPEEERSGLRLRSTRQKGEVPSNTGRAGPQSLVENSSCSLKLKNDQVAGIGHLTGVNVSYLDSRSPEKWFSIKNLRRYRRTYSVRDGPFKKSAHPWQTLFAQVLVDPTVDVVQWLGNLYGLEISACTGNARRISLIQLMMTSTLRDHFEKFFWKNQMCLQTMNGIFERCDTEAFADAYEKNLSWREDINRFIRGCLGILDRRNFSTQSLNALWFEEGQYYNVELPSKLMLCPWLEIFNDSFETMPMAVITNTCLSATGIPSGRTCREIDRFQDDHVPVLETRLLIEAKRAKSGKAAEWRIPHVARLLHPSEEWEDLRFSTDGGPGVLEIKRLEPRHIAQGYCVAEWDGKNLQRTHKTKTFREDLTRHKGFGSVAYILPALKGTKGHQR
ncbi:hypothetical protein ONS95_011647 [Cadophora gregata]|uniref:uncharacterized protein n=1 Tax=Cadophora gregata TaxID=51156 RepID=UPI0026DD929F|nr:uncharacterized protein ONS95_011647 [Cadophora gregata]KAK0120241.1 hypothetical protein ONS95_011647 [Cadophora gregata]